MIQIRNDFHNLDNSDKVDEFIENYQDSPLERSQPYVFVATMKKAKYTFFPNKKLAYFKKGKKRLDIYILDNPNCIEGRYVRLLVQSKTPTFLNYKSNIKTDRDFILKNISTSNLPIDYQELIIKNIRNIE